MGAPCSDLLWSVWCAVKAFPLCPLSDECNDWDSMSGSACDLLSSSQLAITVNLKSVEKLILGREQLSSFTYVPSAIFADLGFLRRKDVSIIDSCKQF